MKYSLLMNISNVVPQSRRILVLKMVLVDTISILPTLRTPEDYSCSIVGLVDPLG